MSHRPLLIITGASRGIGRATALFFRDAGWTVLGLARTPIDAPGVQGSVVDLADATALHALAPTLIPLVAEAPRACLIHNAAQLNKDTVHDLMEADMNAVLAVNVIAPLILNRLLLPHMHSGSSVLWVGSTLATQAVAGAHSYSVSKHAQLGQMRATAQDMKGRGVHAAMVSPGFTDTDMLRTHLRHDPASITRAAAHSLFNRLVEPSEIAATLLFAANHPVINGSILDASLGQVGA